MITFKHKGNFEKTSTFFKKLSSKNILKNLEAYGKEGVRALSSATPTKTGKTASSWGYKIIQNGNKYSIVWTNSNLHNGVPIAIIIQYGHGTGTGGYVQGRDYINPAIQPIFDDIAKRIWKEVTS